MKQLESTHTMRVTGTKANAETYYGVKAPGPAPTFDKSL